MSGFSLTAGSLSGGRGICLARGMYVLAYVSRRVGLQERVTTKIQWQSEYGGGGHVQVDGEGEGNPFSLK